MDQRGPQLSSVMEADGALRVRLSGAWKLGADLPSTEEILREAGEGVGRAHLDGAELGEWDSGLLAFLRGASADLRARGVEVDLSGLPDGVRRLLDLAAAVPAQATGDRDGARLGLLGRIGRRSVEVWAETRNLVTFIGEATLSFGRFFLGRARFQWSDVWLAIEDAGARALGIVGMISFLIGAILAFMGAVQLRLFGAEIYVANLVAIGMSREMSAMMTGVIVAGRTGASYAAQLGTMTVNEEIDALRVLGVDPIDFEVLPRMLALVFMMPLLAIYANLLGILGGMLVGALALGIDPSQYWAQTLESVTVKDFGVGLIKAAVVGVLVAIAGCMRGLQSGRSASAVGRAATSAVVTGIVMIVISEAIFAVIFEVLGI